MSLKRHYILPNGDKMDQVWWYVTKFILSGLFAIVAAIAVAAFI